MALHLQIITPEFVIFDGEVDSVSVPGKNGRFQMLQNHAPIVSTLDSGTIDIHTHEKEWIDYDNESGKLELSPSDKKVLHLNVDGGVLELNNNHLIIMAE